MEQVIDNPRQRYKCTEKTNRIITALLDEKCLTQADLAEKIGCDRAYVNRLIHGTQTVPVYLMIRIAKALQVDSRTIFPDPVTARYTKILGMPHRCICATCPIAEKCAGKPEQKKGVELKLPSKA